MTDLTTALEDYHHDKRWLKGHKPAALGRRWKRGQPQPRRPQRLDHCLITLPGDLLSPQGAETLTYTVKQLISAQGWQARYAEDNGDTFTDYFEYFALCDVVRDGQTQSALFALEYTTEDGWCLVQSHDNFLALIPPWEQEEQQR